MDHTKIINENSPLEEQMEEALKKANIPYEAQYTVYDRSKDSWNAKYIFDFLIYGKYCKVVIECDGVTYHSSKKAKHHDLERDIWTKQMGYDDTLRFTTEQIKDNIDGVINEIKKTIK